MAEQEMVHLKLDSELVADVDTLAHVLRAYRYSTFERLVREALPPYRAAIEKARALEAQITEALPR